MQSIFLSHSSKDRFFVSGLAEKLRQAGVRVWFDQAELKVGDSLTRNIGTAINEMNYFGVVLSKNSIDSEWVQRELQIALSRELAEKKVVVLPILLEEVEIPPFLRDKVCADFTTVKKADESMPRLLKTLGVSDTYIDSFKERLKASPDNLKTNPNLLADIKQILKTAASASRFYLFPNASKRLLTAAGRSCKVPAGAEILAVMNFNHGFFWDVGKRAVVFTDEGVYYANSHKRGFLPYSEFHKHDFSCESRWVASTGGRGTLGTSYSDIHFGKDIITFLAGTESAVLVNLLKLIKLLIERGGV